MSINAFIAQGHGRSNPYAAGCEEVVYDADMDPNHMRRRYMYRARQTHRLMRQEKRKCFRRGKTILFNDN